MSIPEIVCYPLPTADQLPANRVSWQLNPARAVLLIHDMQQYFLRFYGTENPLIEQMTANIARLRSWADEQGIPVVYTAQPLQQSRTDRALLTDMWGPGITAAGEHETEVTPGLTPRAHDKLLTKWRYSAFQRSELLNLMRETWGRDQLIVTGVYAHIGCMSTSLDAFMYDIQPFMVADALADFSQQEHQMALNYVAGRCGAVVTTDQLLANHHQLDRDWLLGELLRFIDEDPAEIDGDENLMDYGLDSVHIMTLVAEWDKLGFELMFEDLARQPTLNGWLELLANQAASQAANGKTTQAGTEQVTA
ncbi:isochorismatase family protein [Oceanobacter mangrovi]|uniref:isochorismatase family protein n=1 Tax=Oceanobacter mangrovi TaxID=2862510 RepID=UPI001C8D5971|nr:isochorismatase family protein [Oceanobacter mangrovi]